MTAKKKPVSVLAKRQSAMGAKPTTPEAPKKERKKTVRKAPLDRALKRARLLDKNASAMLKLVLSFRGEATKDQASTKGEIEGRLLLVAKAAEQILVDLDMLAASGYAPTGGSPGKAKTPLAAGARVAIKEKHFNAALYRTNDFEVVVDAGKQIRIRPTGDLRAAQVDVNRAWLDILDSTDVDDPADLTEGDASNEDEANQ